MADRRYKVRVTKDTLVFSAGHFITFDGDHCERIHGHNYRASVEIDGPLDANEYVFDFIALRDLTEAIVDELDHRMLLPDRSPLIAIEDDGDNWTARYKDRRWSFPKDECVLLPVTNTTTERIADYLGDRLRSSIEGRGLALPERMRVEVEECFGQWAESAWDRDPD